jgi:C1A family cysteine protease
MTGAGADSLDIRVDLRGAWAGVRDQGSRSACVACATSDAHAHCHKRDRPLSAEFLFFHAGQLMPAKSVADGLTFTAVNQALQAEGQPDETEWPYASAQPNPWMPPPVSQRWHGSLGSTVTGVQAIINTVETQRPVVLGVRLTPEFVGLGTAPYVIPSTGRGFGGHAVLAVGLADHPRHGSLVLVRNSWGANWGDDGCGWLCTGYLTDNLIGYRVVNPLPNP